MVSLSISVDQKFKRLHERLDEDNVRVQKLEEIVFSGKVGGEVSKEIQLLKEEIEALKGKHVDQGALMCIAIMGGLFTLENLECAKQWITNMMWHSHGPSPIEVYCKGDFNGILFAKFNTRGERDAAIQIFRKAGCYEGGKQVWMKPDCLSKIELAILSYLV